MKTRLNLTKIMLMLPALFGSLYSASAYYDPSAQRWLNRDPINERGFEVSNRNRRSFDFQEEKNLYCIVQNSPMDSIDPSGLDRWFYYGFHSFIVLEERDKCCNVIGYILIDLVPTSHNPIKLLWEPGVVRFEHVQKPTVSFEAIQILGQYPPYLYQVSHIKSDCEADRELMSWGWQQHLHPPQYSVALYNCYDFACDAIMVGMLPEPDDGD